MALRERIFQTAISGFRERGYEAVPVSWITRESGVAKGTFFNYFSTKDHLLAEVFHRVVNEAIGDVSGLGLAGTDAVIAFARTLLGHLARDRTLTEAVVLRLSSLPAPDASVDPTASSETDGHRPGSDGPSSAPPVRDDERIRRWIEARLGEALPVAVPLTGPDNKTLAFALTWCLRGTLDEWARGEERATALHVRAERRLGFLLESAGLPPGPDAPHPSTADQDSNE